MRGKQELQKQMWRGSTWEEDHSWKSWCLEQAWRSLGRNVLGGLTVGSYSHAMHSLDLKSQRNVSVLFSLEFEVRANLLKSPSPGNTNCFSYCWTKIQDLWSKSKCGGQDPGQQNDHALRYQNVKSICKLVTSHPRVLFSSHWEQVTAHGLAGFLPPLWVVLFQVMSKGTSVFKDLVLFQFQQSGRGHIYSHLLTLNSRWKGKQLLLSHWQCLFI